MQQVLLKFTEKKPKLAALLWDGKLIKDVTGSTQEIECILILRLHIL